MCKNTHKKNLTLCKGQYSVKIFLGLNAHFLKMNKSIKYDCQSVFVLMQEKLQQTNN